MRNLLLKFTVFLFKKVYNGRNKLSLQLKIIDEIKESYQHLIRTEFMIKREIVQVKKGYAKYHMLYIWKDGKKIKVQISRHQTKNKPKEIII